MTTVKYVVLVLLWAVTLWRLPAAVRRPRQRALWAAFAAIAAGSTLGVPGLATWLDARTGVHNLSTLGKNLLGIVGSAAILDFVISIARPASPASARRRLGTATLVSMAALSALFAVTPRRTEVADFYRASIGNVLGTAYTMVFTGCLGIAMTLATWLFTGYSRHAGAAWLRAGLRVLGVGTALGSLYALLRTAVMALGLLSAPVERPAVDLAADLVENAAIALIIVGSSLPAAGIVWRSLNDWRTLRRIQPLWRSLTGAVPDIVLDTRTPLAPRVRLHRAVIEIRDAALVLSAYVPEAARQRAAAAAERSGERGERLAALTEAIWLRDARAARLSGAAPHTSVTMTPPPTEPAPAAPAVAVPAVAVPAVAVPEASVTEASVTEASAPGPSVPRVSVPGPSVPRVSVPRVSVPSAAAGSGAPGTGASTAGERGSGTMALDFGAEVRRVLLLSEAYHSPQAGGNGLS